MRLHKFLSNVGFCSKRDGERLIRAGKIFVNGKKAQMGDTVSGDENIVIDGQILVQKKSPEKKVLLFHKPKGVECSLSPGGDIKTLLDFDFGADRVFPIGRLDRDSCGLLLLTNDGKLGNTLAQPSSEREEEYILAVKGSITSEIITRLSQGIMLGEKQTAPCQVEQQSSNTLKLILHDGRTRQIRKMCETVNLQIIDLMRTRIGTLPLEELKEGKWRILTVAELQLLNE